MDYFQRFRTGYGQRSLPGDSLLLDPYIRPFVSGQQQHDAFELNPSETTEYENYQGSVVAASEENGESNETSKLQSPNTSSKFHLTPAGAPTGHKNGGIAAWGPEILSICVAICCLVAVFTILATYDGQRQPDWPYASALNLSTLIALVATILRSMLATVIESGM